MVPRRNRINVQSRAENKFRLSAQHVSPLRSCNLENRGGRETLDSGPDAEREPIIAERKAAA